MFANYETSENILDRCIVELMQVCERICEGIKIRESSGDVCSVFVLSATLV